MPSGLRRSKNDGVFAALRRAIPLGLNQVGSTVSSNYGVELAEFRPYGPSCLFRTMLGSDSDRSWPPVPAGSWPLFR